MSRLYFLILTVILLFKITEGLLGLLQEAEEKNTKKFSNNVLLENQTLLRKKNETSDGNLLSNTSTNTSYFIHKGSNNKFSSSEINSGAMFRGFIVFGGLSIILIMYLGIKTCFSYKSAQTGVVHKYGVRTKRNDIEMTPLPLSDDEEDETLFDIGTRNSR